MKPPLPAATMLPGGVLPMPATPEILDALDADAADEHRYQLAAALLDEDEGGAIGVSLIRVGLGCDDVT